MIFRSLLVGGLTLFVLTGSIRSDPIALTAEQDHQRLLDMLSIEAVRRGADGDPASPFAANTDESLANVNMFSLPDPLRTDEYIRVIRAEDWWSGRRAEIVEHFDREIYGRVPGGIPEVEWVIRDSVRNEIAGVAVMTRTVAGVVENPQVSGPGVEIQLTLTLPESQTGPAPVILALSFDPEFLARLRERFTAEQWASFSGGGPPWQEQVIDRGWGYAELVATSVQPDSGDGLTSGIIGLAAGGKPRDPDDWGALRAWAWGASRVMDFFEEYDPVDAARVGIEGHSRYGKAALVAMAYDPRFAVAFISSSGEGGAKLWRRNFGEQVGNIAGAGEYHWVAGNFLKYAGPLTVNDLPVDAHELIALCAPRPVFISSGLDGDQWVDPKGMFLAATAAGPVYELLGARGLGTEEFPSAGAGLMEGDIAFRQHELGHTPGPNWAYFLDFAGRYFN